MWVSRNGASAQAINFNIGKSAMVSWSTFEPKNVCWIQVTTVEPSVPNRRRSIGPKPLASRSASSCSNV
ncbi:MAG: hypothetical protein U0835_24380 [Isosphaeraceae bacterium]